MNVERRTAASNPDTVRYSFICWVVVTVVGIIGGIAVLIGPGAAALSGISEADGMSTGALAGGGIIAIVLALIQLWLAFRMRAGRNWARIVLTIVGVAYLLSVFSGGGVAGIFNWIYLVVFVAAVVLMFVPASGAFFRSRTRT
ncbi:hypothetical protein O1W68_06845 [Rhodococcus sp. H36-A4]|uniref:hypothetical protein n=1 Tax=Rhodococcus sp. H36-A4 TaxID=3004353 RepID=UPI0022AFD94B|nr:hypothetical protein [Rhodococcus sp. H36-A4]MCZ4077653.1 hypothetical protein [Rhodococcus sp. H36-A4]